MLIIPKLNMPEKCDDCPCVYDGYCAAMEIIMGRDEYYPIPNYYEKEYERPKFCPLIEKKPGIRILKDK